MAALCSEMVLTEALGVTGFAVGRYVPYLLSYILRLYAIYVCIYRLAQYVNA